MDQTYYDRVVRNFQYQWFFSKNFLCSLIEIIDIQIGYAINNPYMFRKVLEIS